VTRPAGDFDEVAPGVFVHRSARVEVEAFEAGPGTVVNAHARIYGTSVHLGREAWVDEHATIGGGSAFDPVAHLRAGHWLHLGNYSQLNIARGITTGDEVGVGVGTRVFTHGAYLSEWDGFPVEFAPVRIGSRVWLPNAQVNPGVTIGDDVVAAAASVITADVPSGSFVAGTPATVRGQSRRDPDMSRKVEILATLAKEIEALTGTAPKVDAAAATVTIDGATFDLGGRRIEGTATKASETARNQLRRRGIRFPYEVGDGAYRRWPEAGA
jgi:acetyltransferase-like isoleucine patch superfamily enzyme